MLVIAPKLSQRTLTGSLLKHLSKLQVDEEPAIRTNTTILLGNIASHLNEATRKRVLINAFTVRALRDGFAPARGAGTISSLNLFGGVFCQRNVVMIQLVTLATGSCSPH
jgi:SCY1-like protein 1